MALFDFSNLSGLLSGLVPGGEGMQSYVPQPWDKADAALAAARQATMSQQSAIPFVSMTNANGLAFPPATIGGTQPAQASSAAPVPLPQPSPIPPTAQPSSYSAPQGGTTPTQSPGPSANSQNPFSSIASSILGNPMGGGMLTGGGIRGGLQNLLQAVIPNVANTQYQRQIMAAELPGLLKQTGGDVSKALAILTNPKLQEQIYGNPTSLGSLKAGPVEVPVYAKGGNVGFASPSGGVGNLVQLGNEVTKSTAAASAEGKTQGTNAASLPQALAQADQAISLIDNISADPGKNAAVGAIAGRLPAIGGDQANFVAKLDQLRGQAFLQAWQSLKGAGARITNTESMRATDAIGRLQRVQTVQGFDKALSDLRDVIVGVRTRAGVMAGGNPTPPAPQAQTAPSFTQDQLRAEAIRRGLIKQ